MRAFTAASGILLTLLTTRGVAAQVAPPPAHPDLTRQPLPARALLPPMWPEEELPRSVPLAQHRNVGMMIAGMVITGLGAAVSVAAFAMTGSSNSNTSEVGFLIVLPIGGILLPGVGIPLWLSGSRSAYSWDEAARSRAPGPTAVTAGPTLGIGWAL